MTELPPADRARADAYAAAYGELHEAVRRFELGVANRRSLTRYRRAVEDELTAALGRARPSPPPAGVDPLVEPGPVLEGDRPLLAVTGGTSSGAEPRRYDLRLDVDPTLDLPDVVRRVTAAVRRVDHELRAARADAEAAELRAALEAHRDGSLRRRVVDELAEDLP